MRVLYSFVSGDFVDGMMLLGFSHSAVGGVRHFGSFRIVFVLMFPFVLEFFVAADVVPLSFLRECEV